MAGRREQWQPTPQRVVKDAFDSIPDEELNQAVPAQTPEEDAMEELYSPEELVGIATDFSDSIMRMLGIKEDDRIKDSYEPTPGQFVRHSYLPEGHHYWRVISAERNILEVRTGPFHDDTGVDYQPDFDVRNNGKYQARRPGRDTFVAGVQILIDVIPQKTIGKV